MYFLLLAQSCAAIPRHVGFWSFGQDRRWRADLATVADSGKTVVEELNRNQV
jgi:hypothetical protein